MQNNDAKDRKSEYTLLLLGSDARPPLRIRLTRKRLAVIGIAAAALLCAGIFALLDYVGGKFAIARLETQGRALVAQNARLVEKGREKDQQLAFLSDKMRAIELTLERVEEMEGRVKVLSGPEGLDRPLITKGGPTTPRIGDSAAQADVARLYASARDIMDRLSVHRAALSKVVRYFSALQSEILQIPGAWPLQGWVTSLFGVRESPFTGKAAMHDGLDIAAPEGAIIRASASGQVVFIGEQSGYGNMLLLRHGRGITTAYGHLSKALVAEGTQVLSGAPIALVGNTGRSTGPHLHYEVRVNGIPVNPMRFLPPETDAEPAPPAPLEQKPEAQAPPVWPAKPAPAGPADTQTQ